VAPAVSDGVGQAIRNQLRMAEERARVAEAERDKALLRIRVLEDQRAYVIEQERLETAHYVARAEAAEAEVVSMTQSVQVIQNDRVYQQNMIDKLQAEVQRLNTNALLAGSLLDYCIGFVGEIPDPYSPALQQKLVEARHALVKEQA
jgi:choline dehydrogenase-like flavoprotein